MLASSLKFMDMLFPGDNITDTPAFSDLSNSIELINYINQSGLKDLLVAIEIKNGEEINEYIYRCKRSEYAKILNSIIEAAIEAYFSHPEVIQPLTGKASPLFPNETVLDDIDYNLLEPVYLRMVDNE